MVKHKVVLVALCCIAQCAGRSSQPSPVSFSDLEARHSDISIPLKPKPVRSALTDSTIVFDVDTSLVDLQTFYRLEMERMGWNMTTEYQANEGLLLFEKSYKTCSVSLRPLKTGKKPRTRVVILIKSRS